MYILFVLREKPLVRFDVILMSESSESGVEVDAYAVLEEMQSHGRGCVKGFTTSDHEFQPSLAYPPIDLDDMFIYETTDTCNDSYLLDDDEAMLVDSLEESEDTSEDDGPGSSDDCEAEVGAFDQPQLPERRKKATKDYMAQRNAITREYVAKRIAIHTETQQKLGITDVLGKIEHCMLH